LCDSIFVTIFEGGGRQGMLQCMYNMTFFPFAGRSLYT